MGILENNYFCAPLKKKKLDIKQHESKEINFHFGVNNLKDLLENVRIAIALI